jgi:hypothetical protein
MPSGLVSVTAPAPAFYGLAKQRQQVALSSEYATVASNIVIDGAGRLASRGGWSQLNATPISGTPLIRKLHQYIKKTGATEIISATAAGIFSSDTSPTSKLGALTPSAGNWQFVNFNGYVLGWQTGETPIAYNGTGNFADITASAGTLPTGNACWAAFGRVWAVDTDLQTVRYSALLDHTDWSTASGGGSIDMSSVWTQGMDEVVAISSYGSALIVFGKRHIVMWTDGSGSQIGLDPTNMYVGEIIEGVGLVARDCVALVGELDVVFWSRNGVRSLRRTLQEQATPINEITPGNRDFLADALSVGDISKCHMVYSPDDGFVLLSHPDNNVTYCFDTRQPLPDGGLRMTTWTLAPTAMCVSVSSVIYFGSPAGTADGIIGKYTGWTDNGASYRFKWNTGWIMVEPKDRLKLLKRVKMFLYSPGTMNISFSWWRDFQQNLRVAQAELLGDGDEWNIDEWSLMEWSGGTAFHEVYLPLGGAFQYAKFGIDCDIDGRPFAIQSFTIYIKPTRLA